MKPLELDLRSLRSRGHTQVPSFRRKELTSFLRTLACVDNSLLAAAHSSLVAELLWTTVEIWSIPSVICVMEAV